MNTSLKTLDRWSWIRIALAVLLIVGAYAIGVMAGMGGHEKRGYMSHSDMRHMDQKMMKKDGYRNDEKNMMKSPKMDHSTMDMSTMDPMDMSMRDMDSMMKGRTGDALNKAFLEGMIPHHQGAIDMAKYLAGSDKPELVKLGADIIAAQQKEIDQMNAWMKEWGYISTGATAQTGTMMHMMPDGTMMQGGM